MSNYVYLKITDCSTNEISSIFRNLHIDLYNLNEFQNYIVIKIKYDDYIIFKKYYGYLHIKVIKYTGLIFFKMFIKNNIEIIISLFLMIIFYFFCANLIVDIKVETVNNNLKSKIIYELAQNNIDKFTIKKSYNQLTVIKQNILKKLNTEVEWLEITKKGMTYIINVEPKITKNEVSKNDYCNIISTKDGLITGLKVYSGNSNYTYGDYVKKGDILIAGDIYFNDNIVNQVCASGDIYAEVWYKVSISYPLKYFVKYYTGNSQTNLIANIGDNTYNLFSNRYKYYQSKEKEIFNALGIKIIKTKNKEIKLKQKEYDEKTAIKKALQKVEKDLHLKKQDSIIKEKILQKHINNSKIELEIFIVAQEQIGEQVILPKGETYGS